MSVQKWLSSRVYYMKGIFSISLSSSPYLFTHWNVTLANTWWHFGLLVQAAPTSCSIAGEFWLLWNGYVAMLSARNSRELFQNPWEEGLYVKMFEHFALK